MMASGHMPALLDAFFLSAPTGLAIFDTELRVVRVNKAFGCLGGGIPDVPAGRPLSEVAPGVARLIDPFLRQVLATGQPLRIADPVVELPPARGGPRYAIVACFPIHDRAGAVCGAGAAVIDVTEQKRAEQALRDSERRYHELADSLPQTVFEIDATGRLLFANEAAYAFWGYTREEIAGGFNVLDGIVPEQRERVRVNMRRALTGGVMSGEYTGVRKDGSRFPVLILTRPVLADGQPVGLRGLLIDLSEQRSLEIQLRHAQKMEAVGRLAGGLAHDFNNLLTAILGYADLLIRQVSPNDPRLDTVEHIRSASEGAARLVRQLLAFSRKQASQPRDLDLNEVVIGFESMLHHLAGDEVTVVTALASTLGLVHADQGQVEQVIMNLAINARDAMPGGGSLAIETANVDLDADYARTHPGVAPGPYVMLALGDTGVGMSADVKAHLFEPFFSTKESGKGTGLGLATVYAIVHQGGGHIEVDSEPGRGTTFRIYLPRVVAAEASPDHCAV